MKTLAIINPQAGGGRAGRLADSVKNKLENSFDELRFGIARAKEEVGEYLDAAGREGIDRLIVVGGDGTNHVVLNELMKRPEIKPAFASLPVGTGGDWARMLGIPPDLDKAVDWLTRSRAVACDVGKIEYRDFKNGDRPASRFFLNIASAGVSGEVDAQVNRARRRTPLTFLRATVAALLSYKPQRVTVNCDGQEFYRGRSYLAALANGRFFGRGMKVAPNAQINDGLFDVILVEGMSRPKILFALQTVFSGKHLRRPDVHERRSAMVTIHSEDGPLALDLDGEEACGSELIFTILPKFLNILLDPDVSAVRK
jgi:YegS/Rv2252/BmrU family lipid kinase